MTTSIKFIVRYWSSLLPDDFRETDNSPHWVDYSVHPASKLGLHNALLAVHDRMEILRAHGGQFECDVFVANGEHTERLSQEAANALFSKLPRGEVKWLDIHDFLLPEYLADPTSVESDEPVAKQLPLFEHVHTPYDELEIKSHTLDVDV
jgi:hypothetical protein